MSEARAFPEVKEPEHVREAERERKAALQRMRSAKVRLLRHTVLPYEAGKPEGAQEEVRIFTFSPPSAAPSSCSHPPQLVRVPDEVHRYSHAATGRAVYAPPPVGPTSTRYTALTIPEHLRECCVLLQLPPTASSSSAESTGTVMAIPVRGCLHELKEAAKPPVYAALQSTGQRAPGSLSEGWRRLRSQTTVKVSDWKNYDAMEAEDAERPVVQVQRRARETSDLPDELPSDLTAATGAKRRKVEPGKHGNPEKTASPPATGAATTVGLTPSLNTNGSSSAPPAPQPSLPAAATPSPAEVPKEMQPLAFYATNAVKTHQAEALRGHISSNLPLKQLEKLVLKTLPSYPAMSERFRNASTREEANLWFQRLRAELKQWLLEEGYAIDPAGTVCLTK